MGSNMQDTSQVAATEHLTETIQLVSDILTSVIENIFEIQHSSNENIMMQSEEGVGKALISPLLIPKQLTDTILVLPDKSSDTTVRSGPQDGKENMETETIGRENDSKRDKKERVQFSSPLAVYHEYNVSQTSCSQSTQSISDDDSDNSQDVQQEDLSHIVSSNCTKSDQIIEVNVTCPDIQQGQSEEIHSIQNDCMGKGVTNNIEVFSGGHDLNEHVDNGSLSPWEVKSLNHPHSKEQQDLTYKFVDNGKLAVDHDSFHKERENDDADIVNTHYSDLKAEERINRDDAQDCKSTLKETKIMPPLADNVLDIKCRKDESYCSGGQKQYLSNFNGETFTKIPMHASVNDDHINGSPNLFCEPACSEEYPDNLSGTGLSNQDVREMLTNIVASVASGDCNVERFHSSKISPSEKESLENSVDTMPVELNSPLCSLNKDLDQDTMMSKSSNYMGQRKTEEMIETDDIVHGFDSTMGDTKCISSKITGSKIEHVDQTLKCEKVFSDNEESRHLNEDLSVRGKSSNHRVEMEADQKDMTRIDRQAVLQQNVGSTQFSEKSGNNNITSSSPVSAGKTEEIIRSDISATVEISKEIHNQTNPRTDDREQKAVDAEQDDLHAIAISSSPGDINSDEDIFSDEHSDKEGISETEATIEEQEKNEQSAVEMDMASLNSEEVDNIECPVDANEAISNTYMNVVPKKTDMSVVHQNTCKSGSKIHNKPKPDVMDVNNSSSSTSVMFPTGEMSNISVITEESKMAVSNQTVFSISDAKINAIDVKQDELCATAISSPEDNKSDEDIFSSDEHSNKVNTPKTKAPMEVQGEYEQTVNSEEDIFCSDERLSKEGTTKTKAAFEGQGENEQSVVETSQASNNSEEVVKIQSLVNVSTVKEMGSHANLNIAPNENDTMSIVHQDTCGTGSEIHKEPELDTVASKLYPSEDVIWTDKAVISDELNETVCNQTVLGSKNAKINAIDIKQDELYATAISSSPEDVNSEEDIFCSDEHPNKVNTPKTRVSMEAQGENEQSVNSEEDIFCSDEHSSKEGTTKTKAAFEGQGENEQSVVQMDQTSNDLEEASKIACLVQVKEVNANASLNVAPKEKDTQSLIHPIGSENISEIQNEPQMDVVDESSTNIENANNNHYSLQMLSHLVDTSCTDDNSYNNESDTIKKRKQCSPLIFASFSKKQKKSKETDSVVSTDDINPLKRKQTFRFSEEHSRQLKSKCSRSCNSIFQDETSDRNPKALKCLATETLDTMSEVEVWEASSKSTDISESYALNDNVTAIESTVIKSSQSEIHFDLKTEQHCVDKERSYSNADKMSDGSDIKNASEIKLHSTGMQNSNDFNSSPGFITATEYLSQGSSAGFSPCMATQIMCESQEEQLVLINENLLSVSQHAHEAKHVYEIAEDGITTEEVSRTFNSLSTGAKVPPVNTADERTDEDLEEQLDIDQLDELVDKAVDQMVPDDSKDEIVQSDFDHGESLYTPKKEVKPPGQQDGCFKWKYAPSCDLDSPPGLATLEDEDQVCIKPLKTCGKPIRVGLSKRQPVRHRLHKLHHV